MKLKMNSDECKLLKLYRMSLLGISLLYYYKFYFIANSNFQHSRTNLERILLANYHITKQPRKFERALDFYQEGRCTASKSCKESSTSAMEKKKHHQQQKPFNPMLQNPIVTAIPQTNTYCLSF